VSESQQVDTTAGSRRTRLVRWTGLGFIIGSALFAIGVPLSLPSNINLSVSAWTYFVGSIFFTTAGTLQLITSNKDLRVERRYESW